MCWRYSNMLIRDQTEKHPEAKLKTATLKKFVKVNTHYHFLEHVKWRKVYAYYWVLGQKVDWESWSKKFLSHGKCEGNKKLLVSSVPTSGANKIPTHEEYENALEGDMDLNKKS